MTRAELEQYVKERIYPNNAQEITGEVLQNTLLVIVASILERGEIDQYITVAIEAVRSELELSINQVEDNNPFGKGIGINSAVLKKSGNTATGLSSTALGVGTKAIDGCAYAEGYQTTASAHRAHAEGDQTEASGKASHAEGYKSIASGMGAHAEGGFVTNNVVEHPGGKATKDASHAEGSETTASGPCAHAEGYGTTASGNHAHAEGQDTTASGRSSHAGGYGTIAQNITEFACGSWNKSTQASDTASQTRFSIGIGTSSSNRQNAVEVKANGDVYIKGLGVSLQSFLTELEERITQIGG